MEPTLVSRVRPKTLAIGLGIAGLGLLCLLLLVHSVVVERRFSLKVLLLAGVLIVAGFGTALNARGHVCSACNVDAQPWSVNFSPEVGGHLWDAVGRLGHGDPSGVLALQSAPRAAPGAPQIVSFDSESCPSCRRAARFSGAFKHMASNGTYQEKQRTPWVVTPAPVTAQLLGLR